MKPPFAPVDEPFGLESTQSFSDGCAAYSQVSGDTGFDQPTPGLERRLEQQIPERFVDDVRSRAARVWRSERPRFAITAPTRHG